jgi:hypothetical protein
MPCHKPRHHRIASACLVLIFHRVGFGQSPSSTTILASPNPSNYGQPVTLTATVTTGATGKVTFYDGTVILGVGTISGTQARLTTVMLSSGTRKLRAYYQGNGAYAGSSSAVLAQTVVAGPSLGFDPVVSSPGTTTVAIATADFNGDGKQDLVMATSTTSTVTVYLGNGDGTFQAGTPYSVGNYPISLAVADFNGDGAMDIAAANSLDGNVSVLLGNGDGTFRAAVNYPAGSGLWAVAVGDFDGDGDADLVVASTGGTGLAVLLGRGDGTFKPATFISASGQSVAVADFNGDGAADLAVAEGHGVIGVFLGNGDGIFQAPVTIPLVGQESRSITTADLNGDGKPDILVSDIGNGVYVLLGNGDGTFGAPSVYNPGSGAWAALVEDFNGDGKPDLAVINYGSYNPSRLALLAGNGDGTFQTAVFYPVADSFYVAPFWEAAAGDFNGDGKPDLAFASNVTGISAFLVMLGGAGSDLTILTSPAHLQFSVDGAPTLTAPQSFNLTPGTHTIAVSSPQTGPPGTQYVFTGWSDSGAASHSVTVGAAPATYTASFKTQFQLKAAPLPAAGGTVTPASGAFYDSGTSVTLTATPNPPYAFTSWSGDATGATNPLSVPMDAAKSVIANFTVPGYSCDLKGNGVIDASDVRTIINQALGIVQAVNDLNGDHIVNVLDVQIEVNAALGLGCVY